MPKQVEAETSEAKKYYLITGRVFADDEDTAEVFHVASSDQARIDFRAHMREISNLSEADEAERPIYINYVAVSDSPIEIIGDPL